MLDRDGYRPNVAIVVVNGRNQVFWGKRVREHSWQFPQGGINPGETPEQAMYRELHEEVGLSAPPRPDSWPHARVAALRGAAALGESASGAAATAGRNRSGTCSGWSAATATCALRASDHPEFDAWRWHDYWVPLDTVIEFKREVYRRALTELERHLHARAQTRRDRLYGWAQPAMPPSYADPTPSTSNGD